MKFSIFYLLLILVIFSQVPTALASSSVGDVVGTSPISHPPIGQLSDSSPAVESEAANAQLHGHPRISTSLYVFVLLGILIFGVGMHLYLTDRKNK
jgi:hypothetical protein